MTKRILFIVEGLKTEPRFLKKAMAVLGLADEKEIYSVNTNIHALYNSVFGSGDPEDTDLLLSLKSITKDEEDKEILSKSYSDVFLVFDAEIQDASFNIDRMRKLLNHYDNSTDVGKLYLNYPMMESIRHLKSLDDRNYLDSTVERSSISNYKRVVGEEGCKELRNPNSYDFEILTTLARINAEKYLHIAYGENKLAKTYNTCDGGRLFEVQINLLLEKGHIYVINTSILIFVDMMPEKILGPPNSN